MNAIVLVIDRLHAGYLGCYGNTWLPTPAFNRLAGQSFLCDRASIDAPSLAALYRSFWLGRHALVHAHDSAAGPLPKLLHGIGVSNWLVTDEPEVARHPLAVAFDQCIELPLEKPSCLAKEPEDTQLARFFAAAVDSLEKLRPPFLAWLHTRGLAGPWDAPWGLRSQFAEESDPQPPNTAEVPHLILPRNLNPDLLLGIRHCYAGQVALLDACLHVFLQQVSLAPWANETLLIVTSARGFHLGLHGQVGQPPGQAESLYSELTAVPWFLRLPDGLGLADRSDSFAQPADLAATLCDWWGTAPASDVACGRSLLPVVRAEADSVRDRVCTISENEKAIRTPAWYARFPASGTAELYAKPDDRWEINDVANRCGDVTDALGRALADYEKACRDLTATLPALDEVLVRGLA